MLARGGVLLFGSHSTEFLVLVLVHSKVIVLLNKYSLTHKSTGTSTDIMTLEMA